MHQKPFKIVIPARFASSRLPGKPLMDIGGKPMIQHVFERALETGISSDGDIVIATDDERIMAVCRQFGACTVMTSPNHTSGTDRLAEVVDIMRWGDDSIIVNLQGDEPLMPHALINKVAINLANNPLAGIATLSTPINNINELSDTNLVKVVSDRNNFALYFSRAPIPWGCDIYGKELISAFTNSYPQRHLGLYAYRAATLRRIAKSKPAAIEIYESLEQLRALWLGIGIHVESIPQQPDHGVNTAADLERVRAELNH